jgi:2-polyprenyl-6-methoxyphenol hydroxylase-like FAD-dependent oxidoreductase
MSSSNGDNRVLIIGGGIGGLTAAVALRAQGIPVAIFERQSELREVGAGVGMHALACKALGMIGLGDALREIASDPIQEIKVVSHTGRQLAVWPQFGASHAVHRGELLDMLHRGVGDDSVIQTSSDCVGFEQNGDGVTAQFADGREERGMVLIGADGLYSVARRTAIGQDALRYAGYTLWRAIPEFTHPEVPEGYPKQAFGPGGTFGMYPCKGRMNWFATMARPEGAGDPPAGRKQDMLDTYRGWPSPIEELIQATPDNQIDRQDLFDRVPVSRWSNGRVTLMGDAAHPTTPALAQGAGMTIEDGPVLARSLAAAGDLRSATAVAAALADYEQQRIPRTTGIVNASWRLSRVASWRSSAAVTARSYAMSAVPKRAWRKTVQREIDFQL